MSQLDTSGVVSMPLPMLDVTWDDFSPLAQGYTAALLSDVDLVGHWLDAIDPYHAPGFSHLAPETVAWILKDCERFRAAYGLPQTYMTDAQARERGGYVWRNRQSGAGVHAGFPPLTVYVGTDGLIRFAEDAL